MSTAEDLIKSHEGLSVAHHLTFSRKKKKKRKQIQYTAAIKHQNIRIHEK